MTRPTTPRAALLAFADEIDDIDLGSDAPTPAVIATIAHMAREHAQHLPDDQPAAGELFTAELASTPALDVDQQLRVAALQAAATRLASCMTRTTAADSVLDVAEELLPWLRDGVR